MMLSQSSQFPWKACHVGLCKINCTQSLWARRGCLPTRREKSDFLEFNISYILSLKRKPSHNFNCSGTEACVVRANGLPPFQMVATCQFLPLLLLGLSCDTRGPTILLVCSFSLKPWHNQVWACTLTQVSIFVLQMKRTPHCTHKTMQAEEEALLSLLVLDIEPIHTLREKKPAQFYRSFLLLLFFAASG